MGTFVDLWGSMGMRTVLVVIVGISVVAAAVAMGVWYGRSAAVENAARLQRQKDALSLELASTGDRLQSQEAELEQTRLEIDRLQSHIADLEREAKEAAALASVESVDTTLPEPEQAPQAVVADASPRADDRRSRWGRPRDGGQDLTPEEEAARRAEWETRRQEFATRMRENVSSFFDSKLEQAGDAAAQQRILSMEDYSNYMMDLFQQMRATEDEEERDSLRTEMDTARETMRTLVTEQQDQMLRDLASDMGVRSGTRQDEFVTRMRTTMEDPFFQSQGMLGGGGRGRWGGGGFGGGGGPGGDRGGFGGGGGPGGDRGGSGTP